MSRIATSVTAFALISLAGIAWAAPAAPHDHAARGAVASQHATQAKVCPMHKGTGAPGAGMSGMSSMGSNGAGMKDHPHMDGMTGSGHQLTGMDMKACEEMMKTQNREEASSTAPTPAPPTSAKP